MQIFGELLQLAKEQTKYSGIKVLLQRIAEFCDASGAILWRIRALPSQTEYLYASSSWFTCSEEPLYMNLGERSSVAEALKTGVRVAGSVGGKASKEDDQGFLDLLEHLNVANHVTVPIRRNGIDDKRYGCLTLVYGRPESVEPGSVRAEAVSSMLPILADTLSERVTEKLLERIEGIQQREVSQQQTASSRVRLWDPLREAFQEIVDLLRDVFDAEEMAIYVRADESGPVKRVAYHWPWSNRQPRDSYLPGEGTSGYCLRVGKPVLIEDVLRFLKNEKGREKYPGLTPTWSQEEVEVAVADIIRQHSFTGTLPPVPYACFPLREGGTVVGILRMCGLKRAPYYLDEHQVSGLERVSSMLALWIGIRLRYKQTQNLELRSKLGIQLATRLAKSLTGAEEESSLIRFLVENLYELGPEVDAAVFRDRTAEHQKQTLTRRFCWARNGVEEPEAKISWEVSKPQRRRAWADALQLGKIQGISDLRAEAGGGREGPHRSALIAPVLGGQTEAIGTLEIYSTEPRAFQRATEDSMELLWSTVNLAIKAIRAVRTEREMRELHERETKATREGLENLQHQLKTPVQLARQHVDFLYKTNPCPAIDTDLRQIQATTRRAHQVVNHVESFTALARGEEIQLLKVETLKKESFVDRVREACDLFRIDVSPKRGFHFQVREDSFAPLDKFVVRADLGLVDQVLDILLDNAVKYGEPHTTIELSAGLMDREQYFYIAVVNRGPEIPAREIRRLKERGHRSERLMKGRGGAGLGLYIAAEILHAHRGRLDFISKPGGVEVRAALRVGVA